MLGEKSPRARWRDFVPLIGNRANDLFQSDEMLFTYKARAALNIVLQNLSGKKKNKVLLPAFNCPSVVQTVLHCGLEPVFYPLDDKLNPDISAINSLIDEQTLAILVVHYFGFEVELRSLSSLCRAQNISLIEDWSHSFLQANPTRLAGATGDYAIYSFWKIIPTSVGGCVRILKGDTLQAQLSTPPWSGIAGHIRNTIELPWQDPAGDLHSFTPPKVTSVSTTQHKPDNLERYNSWYKEDVGDYDARMPNWARKSLLKTDFPSVIDKRRRNYGYYMEVFAGIKGFEPVFHVFHDNVCPWVFPIYFSGRNERAPLLRSSGIPLFTFGETLHPVQEHYFRLHPEVLPSVQRLIDSCLCLPLHQDITKDMIDIYGDIARAIVANNQ